MNAAHFRFAEPAWLWLAAAGPLLLALLHRHAAIARRGQLARMASPHFVGPLTASHSPARRHWKQALLLLALALAGMALARPQWGGATTENAWLGEDVVFALDLSLSMTARDVPPSRLQRAKFAILDFAQRESHGRVGLVTFAGTAFLQCPLTFDTDAFDESLMAVDEKTMPVPGTDIGRALEEAARAMDKTSRRKLIVLVTDGEDLEKGGVTTAKNLATNGVVVFTIGVGTPTGREIEVMNEAGQPQLLRDEKGQVVRSRLDEQTLREIAAATGGSYYPLGAAGEGLMEVRPAIHALEAAGAPGQGGAGGEEHFYLPLAAMLALLAAEPLIGTRRKPKSK